MPTAKIVETLKKDFAKFRNEIADVKRYTCDKCTATLKKYVEDFKRQTNNEIAAVKNDVKTNSNKIQTNSNKIHVFHNTTTVAIPTTTTTTATTAPERVILITGGRTRYSGYLSSTEVYPEIKTCSTPSLPKKTTGHALFMTAGTTPRVAYCGGWDQRAYLDSCGV